MKTSASTTLAAIIATTFTVVSYGQTVPKGQQKHYSIINCSALKGAPQVCLSNNTDEMVTDIDCETKGLFNNGTKTVDVPKGGIPPHSLTVVNMKSCHTTLIFTLLGGGERKVPNVNTDQSTIIEVPQQ
jgi:hypothetical protein